MSRRCDILRSIYIFSWGVESHGTLLLHVYLVPCIEVVPGFQYFFMGVCYRMKVRYLMQTGVAERGPHIENGQLSFILFFSQHFLSREGRARPSLSFCSSLFLFETSLFAYGNDRFPLLGMGLERKRHLAEIIVHGLAVRGLHSTFALYKYKTNGLYRPLAAKGKTMRDFGKHGMVTEDQTGRLGYPGVYNVLKPRSHSHPPSRNISDAQSLPGVL